MPSADEVQAKDEASRSQASRTARRVHHVPQYVSSSSSWDERLPAAREAAVRPTASARRRDAIAPINSSRMIR